MEYYEQDFLDFEDYSLFTGRTVSSSHEKPYANGDFILENFTKYEKFWKKESRKEYMKYRRQVEQKQTSKSKTQKGKVQPNGVKVKFVYQFLTEMHRHNCHIFIHTSSRQYSFFQMSHMDICQEASSVHNELNAIRLSIIKAVGSVSYQKGGKFTHLKNICIDVPCSQQLFRTEFVQKITHMSYCGEKNFKWKLSASDLEVILGKNWHIFKYRHSSTQRCVWFSSDSLQEENKATKLMS